MAETEMREGSGNQITVKCAFCNGTGKDPFGLLSTLATCQVCGGTGRVTVSEPFVRCPFCKGTGVHPSHRYTCILCHGKGVVPAPPEGEREVCPECGGSGKSHSQWNVPCTKCNGKGFISLKAKGVQ